MQELVGERRTVIRSQVFSLTRQRRDDRHQQ